MSRRRSSLLIPSLALLIFAGLISSPFPITKARADDTCPDPSYPQYKCSGFWQKARGQGEGSDNQSTIWIQTLSGALSLNYIQLFGTNDVPQDGVTFYVPPSNYVSITVNCPLGASCDGFPQSHTVQVKMPPDQSTWVPADSPDSPMVVEDHFNSPTSNFIWLYQACPPGYPGNDYCSQHQYATWTATAMSLSKFNSTGMDGCYYNNYGSPPYSPNDRVNEGHRGCPAATWG